MSQSFVDYLRIIKKLLFPPFDLTYKLSMINSNVGSCFSTLDLKHYPKHDARDINIF